MNRAELLRYLITLPARRIAKESFTQHQLDVTESLDFLEILDVAGDERCVRAFDRAGDERVAHEAALLLFVNLDGLAAAARTLPAQQRAQDFARKPPILRRWDKDAPAPLKIKIDLLPMPLFVVAARS